MNRRSGFTLPPVVAAVVIVALLVGVVGAAVSRATYVVESDTARALNKISVRDVLTGRMTDARGVPLPPASGPGSEGEPLRLHFVPSSDQEQGEAAIKPLLTFLSRRTGLKMKGRILLSYGLIVQSLIEGKTDIAFLTAATYARARFATEDNGIPDDDVVAFLQVVRQGNDDYPGSDLAYRAAFVVRADSPLQRVSDFTDNTTFAMGAPTSGAGSILPSATLNALGLKPRVTRYLGGYPMIVTALLQGAVDVGCVWWSPPTPKNPQNDARILSAKTTSDVFEKTRIVGHTGWIQNEPVVARASVPADVRALLARALQLYISVRTLTPEGRSELEAVGSLVGYINATNADFDPLMETIRGAFANDPEGLEDFQRLSK